MSSGAPRQGHTVAVFGSSEPAEGHPVYQLARRVGQLLAGAGCVVLNGGYGGVMEACSRGARETGGHVIGVTVASFSGRAANRFVAEERQESDLFGRTRRLIEGANAFIILPGRSGTLAELMLVWALVRARQMTSRPVALLGDCWPRLLDSLQSLDFLEPGLLAMTRCALTPQEAVEWALSPPPRHQEPA